MAPMELAERVKLNGWYHTLELAPGVVTPGMFDLRPYVSRYGLPERLDGKRVLDIGTWDGFWAFEMERRGAAEVVASSATSTTPIPPSSGRSTSSSAGWC
jgi:tRNA (mo5U34)-methyltransferase